MSEYRLEMRGVCKSFPGVKALTDAGVKVEKLVENVGNWDQAKGNEIVDAAVAALKGEALQNYYWVNYVKVDKSYFG